MEEKHEKTKVYVYTRVSTAMQVDGYSLDAQKEEINRFVQYRNMRIVEEYTDEGKSGKNINGRPGFQQMLDDIKNKKDGVSFVICFKLSRFGRNITDILTSLKLMKRYGVNLICIKENIDSSMDSGKMMISILGAMAEIERDNINTQTMAGRMEKARQGGWNGSTAPYGYNLEGGKLVINPEQAEHIRIIFDKYVNTTMGVTAIARWMNDHGYKKILTTHRSVGYFRNKFIMDIFHNDIYRGKIAYGRKKSVLQEGTDEEYKKIRSKDYILADGQHEAIISEEIWNAAQAKLKNSYRERELVDKEHQYIYSSLLKCPICGNPMYGVISHGKKRKDGSLYPPYYSYFCESSTHSKERGCNFGQTTCGPIDDAMYKILCTVTNAQNFGDTVFSLVDKQVNAEEAQLELDSAIKAQKQAYGLQRKLESQLDSLDVDDKYYDRKYESLNRRLEETFDDIDEAAKRVEDCTLKLEAIKKEKISKESICEVLKNFDKLFTKMSDYEKKTFVRSFIESIELNPKPYKKGDMPIKTIKFQFPIAYNGDSVYKFSTSENCPVLAGR